jgi:hypothetical protein
MSGHAIVDACPLPRRYHLGEPNITLSTLQSAQGSRPALALGPAVPSGWLTDRRCFGYCFNSGEL